MREPFNPTDPVTAKAIALHTEMVLASIRSCESLTGLEEMFTGYEAYVKTMGVVAPIRDHVQTAFNEQATLLKARAKNARVVRDPTGEEDRS